MVCIFYVVNSTKKLLPLRFLFEKTSSTVMTFSSMGPGRSCPEMIIPVLSITARKRSLRRKIFSHGSAKAECDLSNLSCVCVCVD